ncbi:hypothetical protein QTP70_001001 [Hemibagrus guttatus]|uniref:Tc1-like transposase DDE domain-containing protein n=1 Tax=Hemibagrus guttatus TaxID=175788 RepID=A0AAE0VC20_9TELE|nr:hypothetical protein QTP70_001001 [Hemibagrus guttatus]
MMMMMFSVLRHIPHAEMWKKMRFISHISNLADVQSVRTATLRIHLQVYMLYISVESSVRVVFDAGQNGVGLGHLVPVKGTLNSSAYQDNLDNFMLPTLREEFGDGSFLFQHDCTPVHKARSIKTWMSEFGVEELDWPAQSPDLNLTEHLWDELEWRLVIMDYRKTGQETGIRPVRDADEDSFELHSVDLELEAVEKQTRNLQVKQAQLQQRKAMLESPSAPRTWPAQFSFTPAPGNHAAWMQQQRKARAKPRPRTAPPPVPPVFEISTRNHFAPLRETECDAVPAILNKNIGAVVLHAGTNDIRLRQTEILKKDFRSLVEKITE